VWNVVASTLCSVPGANSVTGFDEVVGYGSPPPKNVAEPYY